MDGTSSSTHELAGISGANANGINHNAMVFNDQVLFNGTNTAGHFGLWVTDGMSADTHEVAGINGASATGINPSDLTIFNGEVLFQGNDASGPGLWVTDGKAADTHELVTSQGSGVSPNGLTLNNLTMLNNTTVVFAGLDVGGFYMHLWVTDGTTFGTHELTGIAGADPLNFLPRDLTVVGTCCSPPMAATLSTIYG